MKKTRGIRFGAQIKKTEEVYWQKKTQIGQKIAAGQRSPQVIGGNH